MPVFDTNRNGASGRTYHRVGSRLWIGDVRRSLYTNLRMAGESVALITVTAPGAQFIPWGCSQDHVHSGKLGCKASESDAREWNASAQRRWSALHRAASQSVRRQLGRGFTLHSAVWQMQSRGLLHMHIVGGWSSELERISTKLYVAELRRLGPSHGFGYVDFRDRHGKTGKPSVMAAERAAGYLSGYLSESAQLLEAVALRHRPRRLVYVGVSLTRQTGCTMRNLRRVRLLYRIRSGSSSIFSLAGTLPRWFGDPAEYYPVAALLRMPE